MSHPRILALLRLSCALVLCLAAESMLAPRPAQASDCCDPVHPCPVRLPCCVDAAGPDVEFLPASGATGRPASFAAGLPVVVPGPQAPAFDAGPHPSRRDRGSPADLAARARPERLGRFLL